MENLQDGIYKVEKVIRPIGGGKALARMTEYARVVDGNFLIVSDGRKVLCRRRFTWGSRPYECEYFGKTYCRIEYRFMEAC